MIEQCRIGSCHRHNKCMYTPCQSAADVSEQAFHVVRNVAGIGRDAFHVLDRATLLNIPARDRYDANSIAHSLNEIVRHHAKRAAAETRLATIAECARVVKGMAIEAYCTPSHKAQAEKIRSDVIAALEALAKP